MLVDADAPPKSQRQWQRDRTVTALEEAALRVFARDGYDSSTAELISLEAGVSLRTFFRYFPHGKEDVMLLEARRTTDRIRDAIQCRPPSEPLNLAIRRGLLSVSSKSSEELLEASRLYHQIARDQPDLLARVIGERQLRAERLVDVLAERMQLDAEADVRPRLLAHLLYATLSSAWLSWLRSDSSNLYQVIEASIDALEPLLHSTAAHSH